jgi:circadian clock protein KaiC
MTAAKTTAGASEASNQSQPIPRVPTGVPGLDVVLKGGLLHGGIYMILGAPGAGKTMLGNQICYNHVATGGRALYVTLIAESHARMLAHLRPLSFFRPDAVGGALYYISGYGVFDKEGLPGLLKMLRRLVLDHKASFMVLDGLGITHAVEELELKRFINDLQVSIEVAGCTALILVPSSTSNAPPSAQTMADGLIVLSDNPVGLRAVRQVEVVKFRGSDHLRGKHNFTLSDEGVHIYPRTEALQSEQDSRGREPRRVGGKRSLKFGIGKFDEMIGGGIPEGTSTILLGSPGSGKTLLGLHFLAEGARNGETGLYFGLAEVPEHLISKAEGLGLPLGQYVQDDLVKIMWQPALENDLDIMSEHLFEAIRKSKAKRVLLDSLNGFMESAFFPERMGRFITALLQGIRRLGATAMLSVETPDLFGPEIVLPVPELGITGDNIILLRYVELRSQVHRLISVLKMRESAHDRGIHEFRISPEGIDVAATFESAEAILTGIARAKG